jgi:hypothetical protein
MGISKYKKPSPELGFLYCGQKPYAHANPFEGMDIFAILFSMIRHFFVSLLLYFSIILVSLNILGIAKHFDKNGKHREGRTDTTAACRAFKFDKC